MSVCGLFPSSVFPASRPPGHVVFFLLRQYPFRSGGLFARQRIFVRTRSGFVASSTRPTAVSPSLRKFRLPDYVPLHRHFRMAGHVTLQRKFHPVGCNLLYRKREAKTSLNRQSLSTAIHIFRRTGNLSYSEWSCSYRVFNEVTYDESPIRTAK